MKYIIKYQVGIVALAFISLYFYSYYALVDKLGALTYSSILLGVIIFLLKPYFYKSIKEIISIRNLATLSIIFTIAILMVSNKLDEKYAQIVLDSILVCALLLFSKRIIWKVRQE